MSEIALAITLATLALYLLGGIAVVRGCER